MYSIYNELLNSIYSIQCQTAQTPKTIKVTTKFYNYLVAVHKNNKFFREYKGETVSYIMGIRVIVDDTIANEHYSVEFEESDDWFDIENVEE